MSYTLDFRKKVLSTRKKYGLSISATAERFDIGTTTLVRWLKSIHEKKRYRRPTRIKDDDLDQDVQRYPDAYHHERAQRLGVSAEGIRDALKRLGYSYKKNAQSPQGEKRRTAYLPEKDPAP